MAHRRKREAFNVHESGMDMSLTMLGIVLLLMAIMMIEVRHQTTTSVAAKGQAQAATAQAEQLSGQLAKALSTLQQTKRKLQQNQADEQAVQQAKQALAQAQSQASQMQALQQSLASMQGQQSVAQQLQAENQQLQQQIQQLQAELQKGVPPLPESYVAQARQSFGLGKRDFDLFIEGLKHLPGKDLHLVVDATGSMHSIKFFLRVLLMAIVAKSGKDITGLTWYANGMAETYHGTQAQMFDKMFAGAPFNGDQETMKHGFDTAVANSRPPPSAFLVLGDEPSNDGLPVFSPSPIFSMPIGTDPRLLRDFQALADLNGGKMLKMKIQ